MGALGAIETPVVAGPGPLEAVKVGIVLVQPPLRVIGGTTQHVPAESDSDDRRGSQPRSSSIRLAKTRLPARPAAESAVAASSSPAAGRSRGTASRGAGPTRAPVRLTRRGRMVLGVLMVAGLTVAVLLVTLIASGGAQATNHGQARAGYQGMREIVVQPGQTLWSIASAAEPSADPRTVIDQIISANALVGTTISTGQLLWVPR